MEIWDRETHERYESGHGGAYQSGTLAPGGERMNKGSLDRELRQSLSLIAMTAASMGVFLGLGLLAARLLG